MIVTILRFRLDPPHASAYRELAARMWLLAKLCPGFSATEGRPRAPQSASREGCEHDSCRLPSQAPLGIFERVTALESGITG